MTVEKLNEAITFAAEKHADKKRKGTSIPYIVHPMEAAAIAASITEDLEVIAAAVLHDTVEDSDATKEDLEKLFGPRVAELVAHESEDKMEDIPKEKSWIYRKRATLIEMENLDRDDQIVVLADKLSNMRSLYKDYRTIGDEVWKRFNVKEKDKHACYYSGIRDSLNKVQDTVAYEDYAALVEKVFGYVSPEEWKAMFDYED